MIKDLKEREEENSELKTELNELRAKYDQLSREAESLMKDKEKMAGVLLQAQEKAETMLQEAQDKALKGKMGLTNCLSPKREKIVDIKLDLKKLRGNIAEILSRYENRGRQK